MVGRLVGLLLAGRHVVVGSESVGGAGLGFRGGGVVVGGEGGWARLRLARQLMRLSSLSLPRFGDFSFGGGEVSVGCEG